MSTQRLCAKPDLTTGLETECFADLSHGLLCGSLFDQALFGPRCDTDRRRGRVNDDNHVSRVHRCKARADKSPDCHDRIVGYVLLRGTQSREGICSLSEKSILLAGRKIEQNAVGLGSQPLRRPFRPVPAGSEETRRTEVAESLRKDSIDFWIGMKVVISHRSRLSSDTEECRELDVERSQVCSEPCCEDMAKEGV